MTRGAGSVPGLPEVSEIDLVRHYTRLSQMNYGVDTGLLPARLVHDEVQPEGRRDAWRRCPGSNGCTRCSPTRRRRGARDALAARTGALRDHRDGARHPAAARRARGRDDRPADHAGVPRGARRRHGRRSSSRTRRTGRTRRACASAGFQAVPVPSDARGLVDVERAREARRRRGRRAHAHQPEHARAVRAGDRRRSRGSCTTSADSCTTTAPTSTRSSAGAGRATWASTSCTSTPHKTFATPHGGGGPGAGPVGVVEELVPYLPAPRRRARRGGAFRWDHDRPRSIGRLHGYHGNAAVLVRAYAYVFLHGADGLKAVSELRRAERELPGGARRGRLPAGVPGRPSHARVRRDGEGAEGRDRDPGDGRREALDRPRVPPVHRVLPARRRRGDDGRAHRDGDEGDASRASPTPCVARRGRHARTPTSSTTHR